LRSSGFSGLGQVRSISRFASAIRIRTIARIRSISAVRRLCVVRAARIRSSPSAVRGPVDSPPCILRCWQKRRPPRGPRAFGGSRSDKFNGVLINALARPWSAFAGLWCTINRPKWRRSCGRPLARWLRRRSREWKRSIQATPRQSPLPISIHEGGWQAEENLDATLR
jgi:hypothetical protein